RSKRDWSSDVCSSDLASHGQQSGLAGTRWAGDTDQLAGGDVQGDLVQNAAGRGAIGDLQGDGIHREPGTGACIALLLQGLGAVQIGRASCRGEEWRGA